MFDVYSHLDWIVICDQTCEPELSLNDYDACVDLVRKLDAISAGSTFARTYRVISRKQYCG